MVLTVKPGFFLAFKHDFVISSPSQSHLFASNTVTKEATKNIKDQRICESVDGFDNFFLIALKQAAVW